MFTFLLRQYSPGEASKPVRGGSSSRWRTRRRLVWAPVRVGTPRLFSQLVLIVGTWIIPSTSERDAFVPHARCMVRGHMPPSSSGLAIGN